MSKELSTFDDGRIRHWDKELKPLNMMAWANLYEDHAYRLVAESKVREMLVKTVWEGIDDGCGVACMWSTGLRRPDGAWSTVWEGYYPCALTEAEAMHQRIVDALTGGSMT